MQQSPIPADAVQMPHPQQHATGGLPSPSSIGGQGSVGTQAAQPQAGLLANLLTDEGFRPTAPRTIEETGLSASLIESLICKHLAVVGTNSGRGISEHVCLPFRILDDLLQSLRTRRILVHTGAAPLNDYRYCLTEDGRQHARAAAGACAYVGPAPVPLMDYVLSVDAQTIRHYRNLGYSYKQIAKWMGVTDATVRRRDKNPNKNVDKESAPAAPLFILEEARQ